MRKLILLLALASLAACIDQHPVHHVEMCDAALANYPDMDGSKRRRCYSDVWQQSRTAAWVATKPYRDLPR